MKKFIFLTSIMIAILLIGITTTVNADNTKNLQDIINNAANNTTIYLENHYTEDIVIKNGKNITINLNGKKLEGKTKDTITVEINAKLTIEGDGEIVNDLDGAAIFNNGQTIINGGTIRKSNEKYYNIANHGIMEFNNGTVINETEYKKQPHASLFENGYYDYTSTISRNGYVEGINQKNPTLIINNGIFDGGLNTVKNDDGAKLVINNGIFKNQIQVAVFNVNDAIINGGTFEVPKGQDKTTVFNRKYEGNINDIGKLTINGGTFNADYFIETDSDVEGEVTINGGIFNTNKGIVNLQRPDGTPRPYVYLVIKGGTFNQAPDAIENGHLIKEINNKYVVKKNEIIFEMYDTETTNEMALSEEEQAKINEIFKDEIENNEEIRNALEGNCKVEIAVVVSPIDENEDAKKEKEEIANYIEEGKIAKYFDITLVIKIDDDEIGTISEPSKKLSFVLTISEDLLKEGREFYILRNHNGKVEKIETTRDGNKLKFETDKFSVYALAYEDKTVESYEIDETPQDKTVDSKEKDETPNTGEYDIVLYSLAVIGIISVLGIVKSRKTGKYSK